MTTIYNVFPSLNLVKTNRRGQILGSFTTREQALDFAYDWCVERCVDGIVSYQSDSKFVFSLHGQVQFIAEVLPQVVQEYKPKYNRPK